MTIENTRASAREALASRVRKLSKMTQENGCSEAEAAFAAQRIADIMAEHALTQDEISIKEDAAHCIQDDFIIFGQSVGDWWKLQEAIARLYACKCWQKAVRMEEMPELGISHPVRPFRFYGFSSDVVACIATMGVCYTAVATEADKERRKQTDFAFGMIERLCQRINDLKPKMQTGSALIVLKDQLVTEEFAKTGIRLRNVKSAIRTIDPQAYARGFAAGAHVDIHGGRGKATAAPAPKAIGRV